MLQRTSSFFKFYGHKQLCNSLVCLLILSLSAWPKLLSANSECEEAEARIAMITENLTQNQWFLRQIIETKNDTVNNVTLFLTPCEKDNFTKYAVNQTYVIHEGKTKCSNSDKEIKGEGTWELEDQGELIIETYLGGREIEKEIIELSETTFKIKYESAGGKYTELTYLSPKAFKDKSLMATIDDPANQAQNLTNIAKSVLRDKGKYQVLGMEHIRNRELLKGTKRSEMHKRVLVYPFEDNTENSPLVNYEALNAELLKLGKELDIDYILTGELLKAETNKNKKGEEKGLVKYNLRVFDVELGDTKDQQLIEQNMKGFDLKPALFLGVALAAYFGAPRYWRGYYGFYFASSVSYANWTLYQMDRLYSRIDSKTRKSYMEKNEAIQDAFKSSLKKLDKFVDNNLPLTLPIHSVEEIKKDQAKTIKIRGGSNCFLNEGDILEVAILSKEDIGGGNIIENKTSIAWLKIQDVENNFLSMCKVTKGGDRLLKEFEAENPDLVVLTTHRETLVNLGKKK
jgi:hypothetical protein